MVVEVYLGCAVKCAWDVLKVPLHVCKQHMQALQTSLRHRTLQ